MSNAVLWSDEMVRIDPQGGGPLDGEASGVEASPVRLRAARNETVSFQVHVPLRSRGDVASVTPGTLRGPGKAGLGPGDCEVHVEWCHRLDGRWWPDALIPQGFSGGSHPRLRADMGLPASTRLAGFWVDVFVPPDARPGRYAGIFKVRSGPRREDLPVELEVLSGRLPSEPALDVSMNNYADGISAGWPELKKMSGRAAAEKYLRIERGVFRAAHDHRAFLHYMPYTHAGFIHAGFAPPLAGEGAGKRVADWSGWDRHFGPYFDGSAFRGTRRGPTPVRRFYLPLNLCWPADFLKFGQAGYAAEWRAVGRDMVGHFRRRGWTRTCFDMFLNHKQRFRFFPWDCEEARFLPDNDLHRYVRKLWEGTFDWPSARPVKFKYTLGTTWTYDQDIRSDLAEFIDVFIANTNGPAEHARCLPGLHRAGRQVWSCLNTASSQVGHPSAAAVQPLLIWLRDLDGFMPRWASMAGWGGDPWHDLPEKGAATFMYPGGPLGSEETFPSVRLKVLRNSLQTVDALQASVERSGGSKSRLKARVDGLLGRRLGAPARKMRSAATGRKARDWGSEDRAQVGWGGADARRWAALRDFARDSIS